MLNTPGGGGGLPPQLLQLLQQSGLQVSNGVGGNAPAAFRGGRLNADQANTANQHLGAVPTNAAGWSNPDYWGATNFQSFTDALRGIVGQDFGFDFATRVPDIASNPLSTNYTTGDRDAFSAGINQHLAGLGGAERDTFVGRLGDWGQQFGASGFQPQGPEQQWWQQQMQQWQQPAAPPATPASAPQAQPQAQPTPAMPVRAFATGGQLDPRAVNIVGDAGPEAIVGNQVVPLRQGIGGALDRSGAFGGGFGAAPLPQLMPTSSPGARPMPSTQPTQRPAAPTQPAQPGQPPTGAGAGAGAFGPTQQALLGGNFDQFSLGQPQLPQQVSDWLSQQLQGNIDFTMRQLMSAFPSVLNSAAPQLAGDVLGRLVADAGAQTSQAALQAVGLDTDRQRAVTERGLGVGGLGNQATGLGIQQQLGLGQLANDFNSQQFQQMLQSLLPLIASLFESGTFTGRTPVVGGG